VRSLLGTSVRAGAAGVGWARDQVVAAGHVVVDGVKAQLASLEQLLDLVQYYSDYPARLLAVTRRAWSVYRSQRGCTTASCGSRGRSIRLAAMSRPPCRLARFAIPAKSG